jgi:hypothetical protein
MGEMRNGHEILVENLKGRDHLEKNSRKWEDNIRMDLKEIGYEGVNWIHPAKVRDR